MINYFVTLLDCGSDFWSNGKGGGLMICKQVLLNKLSMLKNTQRLSWLNLYFSGDAILDLSGMESLKNFFGSCRNTSIVFPTNLDNVYLAGPFTREISLSDFSKILSLTNLSFESYTVDDEAAFCSTFQFLKNAKCDNLNFYGDSRLMNLRWLLSIGIDAESLTKLNIQSFDLNFGNNRGDISGISNFENLNILTCYGDGILNISELSGLKKLNTLNLSGNLISDLSPLERFN